MKNWNQTDCLEIADLKLVDPEIISQHTFRAPRGGYNVEKKLKKYLGTGVETYTPNSTIL
jgi:hypothetical protein